MTERGGSVTARSGAGERSGVERRGVGKRLTDGQRVEIIKLFDSGTQVTEADVARRYGVSRSAIWRLRRASSHIMERYEGGNIESRDTRKRGSLGSASRHILAATASATLPVVTKTAPAAIATADVHVALAPMTLDATMSVSTAAPNNDTVTTSATNSASATVVTATASAEIEFDDAPSEDLAPVDMDTSSNDSGHSRRGNNALALPHATHSSSSASSHLRLPIAIASIASTEAAPAPAPTPAQSLSPAAVEPLVYLAAKAIGSVQSPGVVNWERVSNSDAAHTHFVLVNDGVVVTHDGMYQINIDLEHSQPRQQYKSIFKLWFGKRVLAQCSCPLRTSKEIALSIAEARVRLPAQAVLRVEFLAAGFAFHTSRFVIRRLP